MSEKVREADFELKYRVWELESLYDVGLSIAGTLDLDSLADDILLKSISLLNARTGTLIVKQDGGESSLLVKSFGAASRLSATPPAGGGRGPLVCKQRERSPGSAGPGAGREALAVPIVSDGSPLGLLVVADKENRAGGIDDFGPSDARILSLFANQAAIALENARLHRESVEKEKMEREVEIAASIQRTILPASLPPLEGLRIAAGNRPTRQVGGDYFDVHPLPDGRVAFCVADVSGKGIPAALLVSTVHACIHLLIEAGASDLPRLVREDQAPDAVQRGPQVRHALPRGLRPAEPVRPVRQRRAQPRDLAERRRARLLPSTGLPIGMFPTATYEEAVVTLGPDDVLLLYSDGITEAVDAREEEFGMERLTAVLRGCRHEEPAEMKDRIFLSVGEFTRGVAQYDDQTVLVDGAGVKPPDTLRTAATVGVIGAVLVGACTFSREITVRTHLLMKPLPQGWVNSFNLEEQLKAGYIPEVASFLASRATGGSSARGAPGCSARPCSRRGTSRGAFPLLERASRGRGR